MFADTTARRKFAKTTSAKPGESGGFVRVRDRYGRASQAPAFGEDAGPHWMDQFLMARRLVEAGVRCVTLSFGSWRRDENGAGDRLDQPPGGGPARPTDSLSGCLRHALPATGD